MSESFGTIVTEGQVEQWIMDLTELWFPEYLAAVERQLGHDPHYFPALKSIVAANEFDNWPEDVLPCLMVLNTGLAEPPSRQGDGKWNMTMLVGCPIIVSTPTRADTRWAAHAYGAAFRTMIAQHRSLGHPDAIAGASWVDGRPAPISADAERTLAAMNMLFRVEVKGVSDERGAPPAPEPREDPYVPAPDLGTVQTTGKEIRLRRTM